MKTPQIFVHLNRSQNFHLLRRKLQSSHSLTKVNSVLTSLELLPRIILRYGLIFFPRCLLRALDFCWKSRKVCRQKVRKLRGHSIVKASRSSRSSSPIKRSFCSLRLLLTLVKVKAARNSQTILITAAITKQLFVLNSSKCARMSFHAPDPPTIF